MRRSPGSTSRHSAVSSPSSPRSKPSTSMSTSRDPANPPNTGTESRSTGGAVTLRSLVDGRAQLWVAGEGADQSYGITHRPEGLPDRRRVVAVGRLELLHRAGEVGA